MLLRGRSKRQLKPIMIDTRKRVDNYRAALEASVKNKKTTWHHDIRPAPAGASVWARNRSTKWTSYDSPHPPLVRNGSRG